MIVGDSRSKIVYPGGWIRIRPLMNQKIVPVHPGCRVCRRLSCATSWFHLGMREIECDRCHGDPWDEEKHGEALVPLGF